MTLHTMTVYTPLFVRFVIVRHITTVQGVSLAATGTFTQRANISTAGSGYA
jgi:hypothetical protein